MGVEHGMADSIGLFVWITLVPVLVALVLSSRRNASDEDEQEGKGKDEDESGGNTPQA